MPLYTPLLYHFQGYPIQPSQNWLDHDVDPFSLIRNIVPLKPSIMYTLQVVTVILRLISHSEVNTYATAIDPWQFTTSR